jgi:hypothetical protein
MLFNRSVIRAKNLVAGLHVRQVQIAEHVGNQGEPLVDHGVPEGQHADLFAGHVARAEDGIGAAIEQRAQQARIFARIVLEVGILHDGEVAHGLADGRAHGRALASIALVPVEPDLSGLARQPLQNRVRAVSRTIVDDHQLALHVLRNGRRQHLRDAAFHHGALVVDRHQNRQFHREYRV